MKVFIHANGEPDSGIPATDITISDLNPDGLEDRKVQHKLLVDCFAEILGEPVSVIFEDEDNIKANR